MAKKRRTDVEATKAEPVAKAVRLDLSLEDHKRVDRVARIYGLSMSAYARMAVLKSLQQDETELRKQGYPELPPRR